MRPCQAPEARRFPLHDLHHTFASRMLRALRSLERIQEAMRHASLEMTRRHAHVLQEDVGEAKWEAQKGGPNSPGVTRFSTKSSESESGAMNYIIDFIWLPGPDSNQRPSG